MSELAGCLTVVFRTVQCKCQIMLYILYYNNVGLVHMFRWEEPCFLYITEKRSRRYFLIVSLGTSVKFSENAECVRVHIWFGDSLFLLLMVYHTYRFNWNCSNFLFPAMSCSPVKTSYIVAQYYSRDWKSETTFIANTCIVSSFRSLVVKILRVIQHWDWARWKNNSVTRFIIFVLLYF
jgi:hypothetical protein